MSAKLRRCPFCGSEEVYAVENISGEERKWHIICLSCQAQTGTIYNEEETAALAWNNRQELEQIKEHTNKLFNFFRERTKKRNRILREAVANLMDLVE